MRVYDEGTPRPARAERGRVPTEPARTNVPPPQRPRSGVGPRTGRALPERAAREVGQRAIRPEQLLRETPRAQLEVSAGPGPGSLGSDAGRPLLAEERSRFEPLLGRSLAEVRIHEGPEAAASAAELGTRAWARAGHVVLGEGISEAERPAVLAHELVHAMAQEGLELEPEARAVGGEHAPEERDTERAAQRLLWGQRISVPVDLEGSIRRLPPGRRGKPLIIRATGFQDAANQMRAILDELGMAPNFRLVVMGARAVVVFDRSAVSLGRFQFRVPRVASSGVHVRVSRDLHLRYLVRQGNTYVPGGRSGGNVDFNHDIDRQQAFGELLRGFIAIYVVPAAAETTRAPPPPEAQAEPDPLLRFKATGEANIPAWPGAVLPLTPQLTASNTTGTFLMRVENNQGLTTLERVTNLMQPILYNWEVLKLTKGFQPMEGGRRRATRLGATAARYERRLRDLEADRRTLLGERPERQSLPERAVRQYIAEQMHRTRTILAMSGETVMTFVRMLSDRPENPFSEDIIDVPFREPGDYFVRCLATPVSSAEARYRRASTVAGVSVSVFDIAEFARDVLGTDSQDEQHARRRLKEIEARLAAPAPTEAGNVGAAARRARERAFLGFERTYRQAIVDAGGDQVRILLAERAWVRERIAWLSGRVVPPGDEAFRQENQEVLGRLRAEERRLDGLLERSTGRLGLGVTRTGIMRALLVDEATGNRMALTFSFGERRYIVTDRLEVSIADITSGEGGRVFTGMGDGWSGAGRGAAVRAAMRDLRMNLNRGRGWLAYRMPPVYRGIDLGLPNPMQLQIAPLDQVAEMAEDAAHAATLAALVAAPFTGGASMQILAVLSRVQAAVSLYRIVNRAMYRDLRLDTQAISDFIGIASTGLGGVGGVSRLASRGVQIAASARNVAVRLLDAGNYIVVSWETFRALTAPDTEADPREARRNRLMALLNMFEAASIPVASHMWPGGAHPRPGTAEPGPPGAEPRPPTVEPRPGIVEPRPPTVEPRPPAVEPMPPAAEQRAPAEVRRAAPGAKGRLTDFPDLRRGLPSDLAGRLPIARETSPDFGRTTVRVEYTIEHGVITDIRLRVGRNANFRHIAEHVRTVRAMQRYQGLSGRVRVLMERVLTWFRLHPDAPLGSRAWEARLELDKLPPIIAARAREMVDPSTPPERRAELLRELEHLESQLAENAATVESMAVEPGRGYVAAEGLSAGAAAAEAAGYPSLPNPKERATDGTSMEDYVWRLRFGQLEVVNRGDGPKMYYDPDIHKFRPDLSKPEPEPHFEETTSRTEAYEALGGRDEKAPFGRYTRMLIDEGLAPDHETLVRQMQEPGNLTYRTVRHNLKTRYKELIIEHLTDAHRLTTTPLYRYQRRQGRDHIDALRIASHAEMVRLTQKLYWGDSGAIAEQWYGVHWHVDKAVVHVPVSQADAERMGTHISTSRVLDRVSGSMIEEIKNVSTALPKRDRAEIMDQLALVGYELSISGHSPRHIDYLKVAFVDPEGVLKNARYMYWRLAPNALKSASLIFEIYSARGDVMLITTNNRGILNDPVALRHWVRTGRLR